MPVYIVTTYHGQRLFPATTEGIARMQLFIEHWTDVNGEPVHVEYVESVAS